MMYNAFNVDEIGSSHIEKGLPKQDSSDSASGKTKNNIPYAIAIVADGHGGSQYFRSDKGSKLAVEVCKEIVLELIEKNIDAKKNEDKIKRKIKINWDKKVTEHFEKEGKCFNSEELEHFRNEIEQTDNSTKKNKLNEYLKKYESADKITPVTIKAYGSTLIAVATWNDIVMGIHIGDGTCVALYEDGTMDQPIPEDENNVANIAGSLCNKEPNCRVYFFEKMPIAVFVASDGLDDSFGYGGSLYQFYRKLCMNFIDDGPDYKNTLQKQLSDISAKGSHDDMSIAGIYNYELLCNYKNVLKAVIELGETEVQLAKCQERNNGLEYQIKAKQTKFENAKKNKSDAEEEIKQMYSKIESIERDIKRYQDFILEKTENYKMNSSFIEAKKNFLISIRKKISGIEEEIQKYNKELKKHLEDKSKLDEKISLKQKNINQLSEKKNKLERDLDVDTKLSDLESMRSKLVESIDKKRKEYNGIQNDFNVSRDDFEEINSEKEKLNESISNLKDDTSQLQKKVQDAIKEFQKSKFIEKPCVTVSTENHLEKPINDSDLKTDSKVIESQENKSDGIETLQDGDINKSDKTGLSVVKSNLNNLENSSKLNASTIIIDTSKKEVNDIIKKCPFFEEIVDRWIAKDHPLEDDEQYWEDYIKVYEFFEKIIKEYPEINEKIEKYPVLLINIYCNYKQCKDLKALINPALAATEQQIGFYENQHYKEKEADKRQNEEAMNMLNNVKRG